MNDGELKEANGATLNPLDIIKREEIKSPQPVSLKH